ncbi:MAG: hypothetical protein FJY53_05030 [Betaproteobacteria bacterium]|nr:hypothetical protein [Betaproteobacteria bacterium]
MLKVLSTQVLQHLIAQNRWANDLLRPYAGKAVQFHIAPLIATLTVLENGSLAMAGETAQPDATITIPPSLLLRLIAKDDSAKLMIKIEGDAELASTLAKVINHMRWDYERDISQVIGDVPAYKISAIGKHTVNAAIETAENLASMLSEYWQEENPLLAKKRHVEQLIADVDTLRADVERLEKRLHKITLKQPLAPTQTTLFTE